MQMQWLLVTDLDNTLVGDEAALVQLNEWLIDARAEKHVLLVYSTGRSLESYRQLCTETPLLSPDVLVTSVGTEIYSGSFDDPDPQWSLKLQQNWDRSCIQDIAARFDALISQPNPEQRPFKVSYFLEPALAPQAMAELSEALQSQGLSTQLVYSGGKDLDILPQSANKGKALEFVQAQFGMGAEKTIACGDSGNDIALFGENRGIIVGNAQVELLDWHHQNPAPLRYRAKAHYANGILEGLRYFDVLPS
jgi:sucrose-6-phosphatase